MTHRAARLPGMATGRAPWHVRLFSRVLTWLLGAGVPLGFNRVVTIRGRKSGFPRTTALAVIQMGQKRWVWAPWGDVNWVQNLRAAGHVTVVERGEGQEYRATELDAAGRVAFFRDVLGPIARSVPLGYWFIRLVDGVDLNDPVAAATGRPVFELQLSP
jgi:deazaflavin-dependent oxidoreductase (nitroreductase family)